MADEFIEGWDVRQILGEGTFAEVKLLLNRTTGEACAMKEIDFTACGSSEVARETVMKEICVHKLLKHDNIVKCYGSRQDADRQFIFLEYCAGGELFDKIEPEAGMPEHQANHFFLQLLDAVEYLHSRGVAHRDIKPENILLTEDPAVLKLSDFGLATVFRHKGKERLLERRCGTLPYIAPEVLTKSRYHAEPADVWSCGMVLLAMLVGELPWDLPTAEDPVFEAWRLKNYCRQPIWQRLENLPLSLLRKVLCPTPSKRATIDQIRAHLWSKKAAKDSDGDLPNLVGHHAAVRRRVSPSCYFTATQPAPADVADSGPQSSKDDGARTGNGGVEFPSFSQPAFETSANGSTSTTQTQMTQSPNIYQKLVKRVTRFWTEASPESAEAHIRRVSQRLGYKVDKNALGVLTLETKDKRGAQLVIKCSFFTIDTRLLMVDFRLSRGCGLEFKKRYRDIKSGCSAIVDKAPAMWPAVIPLKTVKEQQQ